MNKNIIKKHLSETFISEVTKHPNQTATETVIKKSGATNKAAMKDVAKEMKDYDDSSKTEKENEDSVKKYTNSKEDQELHDVGENQSGSIINLESENPPNEVWEEKQRQAITGKKSIQGNAVYDKDGNPLGNVITADQAGFTGPEANQKIYDNNKKFKKKEAASMKSAGMGDVQVGQQQFNENKNTLASSDTLEEVEKVEERDDLGKWNEPSDDKKDAIGKWVKDRADSEEDTKLKKQSQDLGKHISKTNNKKIEENNKKTMKKKNLIFENAFNGIETALTKIPNKYKVDNLEFNMTDGNEKYEMKWEGTLEEGRAIVLSASDKNLMTEDMQKMKHLMGYKSEETLGLVHGAARIDENASFADVLNKTKKLLSESEEGKDTLND